MDEYEKRYGSVYSFHYEGLTLERKWEIMDWLKSLPDDNRKMVEELLNDQELKIAFDNSGASQ